MDIWTVAQAKAKLSELIENARTRGPQTITRNGRRTAVVVDVAEWEPRARFAYEAPPKRARFGAVQPARRST